MGYQASKKRLIHLLSVAIFSSLLFVGVIGVNSAHAEILDGSLKNLEFCDDGLGNDTGVIEKLLNVGVFNVTQTGTLMEASITIDGVQTFTMTGNILESSAKGGVFQIFGTDGPMRDLAMNGKYKLKGGALAQIAGQFQAQDLDTLCISLGKFKAVNLAL